jgi:hypothetical protein
MTKPDAIELESQGAFVALLSEAVGTAGGGNAEAVVAALIAALGGGKMAAATLASWDTSLAYARAPLPAGSVLAEERLASRAAYRMVLPVENERVQRVIDAEEAREDAARCPVPGCGATVHSRGREPLTVVGLHGRMTLSLRKSSCTKDSCRHSFAVAGRLLGPGSRRFTPGAAEAITLAAVALPFGKAMTLLANLLHLEVSEHGIQNLVETRGRVLATLDEAAAKQHAPYEDNGLARCCGRPEGAVTREKAPEVAYVETDGVLPMVREEDVARSRPEAGARGGKGRKFKVEGREVKNAVLYTETAHAQEMPSRGCLLERRCVSFLGHWLGFAALLWVAMLTLRFDQAKLLVLLSDGAEWIRSLFAWLPLPKERKLLILDFYHAAHRVWELAALLHGAHSEECGRWARLRCEAIRTGGVDCVLRELRDLHGYAQEVQDKIAELAAYFENNQDRMNYPQYEQRGLRITSGIVESANFHVTGARLKQQGMRWSEQGAAWLAALRADLCSGLWAARTGQMMAASAA